MLSVQVGVWVSVRVSMRVNVWVNLQVSMCTHVYAQCADTSMKTLMLQIGVSRRPMAKLKCAHLIGLWGLKYYEKSYYEKGLYA
jgi:hypothetical protein